MKIPKKNGRRLAVSIAAIGAVGLSQDLNGWYFSQSGFCCYDACFTTSGATGSHASGTCSCSGECPHYSGQYKTVLPQDDDVYATGHFADAGCVCVCSGYQNKFGSGTVACISGSNGSVSSCGSSNGQPIFTSNTKGVSGPDCAGFMGSGGGTPSCTCNCNNHSVSQCRGGTCSCSGNTPNYSTCTFTNSGVGPTVTGNTSGVGDWTDTCSCS